MATAVSDVVKLETPEDEFTDDEVDHELDDIANKLDEEAAHIIVSGDQQCPREHVYIPADDEKAMLKIVNVINKTNRCFVPSKGELTTVDGTLVCKAQETFSALLPEMQEAIRELYRDQDALTIEHDEKIGKYLKMRIYCYSQRALEKFWLDMRNMWNERIQRIRKQSPTVMCVFADVPHLRPEQTRHFFGVSGHRIKALTDRFSVHKGLIVEDIPESLFGTQQVLIAKWAVDKLSSSRGKFTLSDFRMAVIAEVENAIRIYEEGELGSNYESF